jgi:hypothetical protein
MGLVVHDLSQHTLRIHVVVHIGGLPFKYIHGGQVMA